MFDAAAAFIFVMLDLSLDPDVAIEQVSNNNFINIDGKKSGLKGEVNFGQVPTRDAEIQTVERSCLFPSEQYFE